MKVTMLKTVKGSEDGIAVKVYEKNKDYNINEYLYKIFIGNDFCKDFVETEPPIQNGLSGAPNNKDASAFLILNKAKDALLKKEAEYEKETDKGKKEKLAKQIKKIKMQVDKLEAAEEE